MAIKISSLGTGQFPLDGSSSTILDASAAGEPSKVVRSIRLVNVGTSEIGVNLWLDGTQRFVPPPSPPVTVLRRLLPPGTKIPAGGLLVMDEEVTLEAGQDSIVASVTAGGSVDYVISGFTRDL